MATQFEGFIQKLTKQFGIEPEVSLDSPVELVIEDMILTLHYDNSSGGEDIIASATLGQVAEHAELFIYRALLEGNLFWSATGDATIGVNSDTRDAFLAYKMAISDFDGEELATIVAHFLQIAEEWKTFISEANTATLPSAPDDTNENFLRV